MHTIDGMMRERFFSVHHHIIMLCRENYNVTLPHLPDKADYCSGSMSKEKAKKFEEW
jgi:hypothetical protein